jgi:hypothetical protein
LSEGKRLNILTGSNEKQNGAMKRLVSDSLNLTEEMNKEIENIIAQSKL